MGGMSDWAESLDLLRTGDLAAFDRVTRFVTGYLARIGAYDYRDSWDDLVQEVLISLLGNPPESIETGAVIRHIQTTTYRKFVDQVRRDRGRRRIGSSDEAEPTGWRRQVPLDELSEQAQTGDFEATQTGIDEGLRKSLATLDERERNAIECRYVLGCSNDEGAKRLGVSAATYKRSISKALGLLRRQLIPADEPP